MLKGALVHHADVMLDQLRESWLILLARQGLVDQLIDLGPVLDANRAQPRTLAIYRRFLSIFPFGDKFVPPPPCPSSLP